MFISFCGGATCFLLFQSILNASLYKCLEHPVLQKRGEPKAHPIMDFSTHFCSISTSPSASFTHKPYTPKPGECWTAVLDCFSRRVYYSTDAYATRSSGYRSRIQYHLAIKGAVVVEPFLDVNSFPALVGHSASHWVSRSLCDLHVQTAISEPLVWTIVAYQSTAYLPVALPVYPREYM